jgi:hypothetical protein
MALTALRLVHTRPGFADFQNRHGHDNSLFLKPQMHTLQMTKRRKMVSMVIFVAAAALCAYVFWWRPWSERSQCRMQLRMYNTGIASCGMDSSAPEAWKNPEATEKLVERLFGYKLPECPSGGTYSMVYGRQPNPWLPVLVCSLGDSCGHQNLSDLSAAQNKPIAASAPRE